MGLFFVAVIVFILADIAIRMISKRIQEGKIRKERTDALAVSLNLDYSREAKSLKRVEVENPKARILCVDDEEVILDSFRKILVLDGYTVDTVQRGQEALGLLQVHHYDFVFTDLKMPEMDGVDVTKAVKHIRPDIDVIIITGFATVETAVECMKFGAMDYVQKPFTEDELLAFTKKALMKRQDKIQKQLGPSVQISQLAGSVRSRTNEFQIPGGVFVSSGHCWAALSQDGTVKIGLDDFAKKLIGKIDAIEMPNLGMTVQKGQTLFSVKQKNRSVPFTSPVSGKLSKLNIALAENLELLDVTPYGKNWVCVVDASNIEAEIRELRIGNEAVALYQEDIDRFSALMQPSKTDESQATELRVGVMESIDDTAWTGIIQAFFK
jgi:CheY-like chemotaxis protein/glycine cleavage system H lipoate-binding protein